MSDRAGLIPYLGPGCDPMDWLICLSRAIAGGRPPEEQITEAILYAALLEADGLLAQLNMTTLTYVAGRCPKYWPSYGRVRGLLLEVDGMGWRPPALVDRGAERRTQAHREAERLDADRADLGDEAVVRARVAAIEALDGPLRSTFLRLLRSGLETHAPRHLHLAPAPGPQEPVEGLAFSHQPRVEKFFGGLNGEQLAELDRVKAHFAAVDQAREAASREA